MSKYVEKNKASVKSSKKLVKSSHKRGRASSVKSGKKNKAVAGRGKLHGQIARYARAEGVPVALAHAVIKVESNYRVNARGSVGEIGLMQIRLQTARLMGYRGSAKNLYNPSVNLKWGMKYLGKARKLAGGNMCGTILRYNAGHGAKRMNKVSASYCGKIKSILRA
ncbi:MAG: transglycosylase SLT domain-containing protein [Rhizobiaceae bacterium]